VTSSVDLFEFADDLTQQSDLKKKIKKTNMNEEDDFSLDNFKLFRNKINQDILVHLRLLLLNNEDIKDNRDIPSYIYNDFKQSINDSNEQKCKIVLKNAINLNMEYNNYLKGQMNNTAIQMLNENSQLVNYLNDKKDQIDCEELDHILCKRPVNGRTKSVLKNYYMSVLDEHLLQQNLKILEI
jgi:hypothetical protein